MKAYPSTHSLFSSWCNGGKKDFYRISPMQITAFLIYRRVQQEVVSLYLCDFFLTLGRRQVHLVPEQNRNGERSVKSHSSYYDSTLLCFGIFMHW